MYVTQCLFCLALACQRRFFLYFLHFFFHTIAPKVRENVYNQNSSLIEMNWFRVATTSTFHFDHLKLYTWQLSVFVLSIRALSLRFFCFALFRLRNDFFLSSEKVPCFVHLLYVYEHLCTKWRRKKKFSFIIFVMMRLIWWSMTMIYCWCFK